MKNSLNSKNIAYIQCLKPKKWMWMGRSRVRVQFIPMTLKMVLTAPQPEMVMMSLSIGNALAIKRRSSYLIQWSFRQRWYNSKS